MAERAAQLIRGAEVLVYCLGAGIGADSGLGTFRGRHQVDTGFGPLERGEETPYSLSKARRFDENPNLAWGYHYTRECNFRAAEPHEGYRILLQWTDTRPYAVFTSNIDCHFERALRAAVAAMPDALVEYHGSVKWMQCHVNCKKKLHPPNTAQYEVDPKTGEADSYPVCPDCRSRMRHNVCLISDGAFNDDIRARELARMKRFETQSNGKRVVVVEIGAGRAIPTVRNKSIELVRTLGATLVRINLDDAELDGLEADERHVSIGERGALDALREIALFR